MSKQINMNADLGESFGAWSMGNDAAMLSIVQSANVACGFHASDPGHMSRTISLCLENGVSIGAHPGFPDLQGFGRRPMGLKPQEVYDLVAYQIGALQALCSCQNTKVTHVKAHGALSNMAMHDAALAKAIAKAIHGLDPSLILLAIASTEIAVAGRDLGLRVAEEIFADRAYEDDGTLVNRNKPGAMIKGGEASLKHVDSMLEHQAILSINGKHIPTPIHSICVHGDEPTAVEAATHLRAGLVKKDYRLCPLTELDLLA